MKCYLSFFNKNYFLLILIVFIIPYFFSPWWKFIPITMLILWLSFIVNKLDYLGITIAPPKTLCGGLLIAWIIIFHQFIVYQLKRNDIVYLVNPLIWYVTVIFQTLNEELVLRAALLKTIAKIIRSPYLMASFAAICFSLLHLVFYYYAAGIVLSILAVVVIFLFGFICNLLFLKYQHIWYGYILHLSWNLTRFTGDYFYQGISKISEGSLFNILEGSYCVLLMSVIGLVYTVILMRIKPRT